MTASGILLFMLNRDGDYIMTEANDDVPVDVDSDVIMREAIDHNLDVRLIWQTRGAQSLQNHYHISGLPMLQQSDR